MWLSLFCLLVFIGVAFFQSIHGLLSSFIFCMIALVSTALAFGVYEYVAYEYLVAWKPDYALPIALVGCFAVPLILLRVGLDMAIRRSSLLPDVVDKIGAFAFGVLTSLLCTGVMVTAIQMLPFGGSFIGFSRFEHP